VLLLLLIIFTVTESNELVYKEKAVHDLDYLIKIHRRRWIIATMKKRILTT